MKVVGCPYCRKTVTAPTESTLTEMDQVPTAAPMVGEGPAPAPEPPPVSAPAVVEHPNGIALVAFWLAILAGGLFAGSFVILSTHETELAALQEATGGTNDFAANMEAQQKFMEEHPEVMGWLVPLSLMVIAGLMIGLAALICAIIGVRHTRRRGLAIAALVITASPLLFCCGSTLVSLMA